MNAVFLHGSILTTDRAHWVQILNTAHAMARLPGLEVTVIPRTCRDDAPTEALKQMGLEPLPNFSIVPLVDYATYTRHKFRGDLLAERKKGKARRIGQEAAARHFDAVAANGRPTFVVTRDQDVPTTCAPSIERHKIVLLNELHKFEHVKKLEGKIGRKRIGRWRLSHFKALARRERAGELERLARFDGVVCTTESIRERLAGFGFDGKTLLLPNGAPVTVEDAPSVSHEEKDIEILYVGQLYRWKGIDLLVEAMVHLPDRKLTIVGGNQEEDFVRLKALADRLGVRDRIEFLGHQPHGTVATYMRRARVGVVPLPRAGFPEARLFCSPLKALEMMAVGTPMVATRLRSLEGLLHHGRDAWLAPPDDPKALADAIATVLESRDLQDRLAEGGRTTARELSYHRRAERLVAFAREVRPESFHSKPD